jgi:hypothetical protein
VGKHGRPIMLEVLVNQDAWGAVATIEVSVALRAMKGLAPHIAIQFDHVEIAQEHAVIVMAVAVDRSSGYHCHRKRLPHHRNGRARPTSSFKQPRRALQSTLKPRPSKSSWPCFWRPPVYGVG